MVEELADHPGLSSQSPDDLRLLEFLHDRDAQCPLCQYNLRGLTSPRCPECGQALKLSIGLAEPYFLAWIALVATSCLAAGPGLVIGIAFIVECLRWGRIEFSWPRRAEQWFGLGILLFCLVSIPVAIVTIARRRKFMALSRSAQWKISGGFMAIAFLAVLTFLKLIIDPRF